MRDECGAVRADLKPARQRQMSSRIFTFAAGDAGEWQMLESRAILGEPLARARALRVLAGGAAAAGDGPWALRGITSNERYLTRAEKNDLLFRQAGLGRPEANCAALIPIRKNAAWWALTQDERRQIFESRSHHAEIGLKYLPAVARRLHHCRDLGESEPFDFLTWFEFSEADEPAFDALLRELRRTEEWRYVEREAEIRLRRHPDGA